MVQAFVIKGVVLLFYALLCSFNTTAMQMDWSPEFLSQTRKISCILGNVQRDVTFLHGIDSGNFKKLGKVADMEVCVLLCCEMDQCEAAFLANRNCYAVECHSQVHCTTAPARRNKWHPSVVFIKKINQSVNDETTGKMSMTHASKEKSADNGKHSQIPQTITSAQHVVHNGPEKGLMIPAKIRPDTVQMEETQPQKPVSSLDKRKLSMRRRELLKKSRDSMVSAAVVTCSMAVLLSGVALIAARMRKQRESLENQEYSSLPTTAE